MFVVLQLPKWLAQPQVLALRQATPEYEAVWKETCREEGFLTKRQIERMCVMPPPGPRVRIVPIEVPWPPVGQ